MHPPNGGLREPTGLPIHTRTDLRFPRGEARRGLLRCAHREEGIVQKLMRLMLPAASLVALAIAAAASWKL